MSRDELESAWPLVVRHYEAVVRVLGTRPTAKLRKVSRKAVLEDCRRTRDIRVIAAKHQVSPSVSDGILVERSKWLVPARAASRLVIHSVRLSAMTLTDVPASLVPGH